jgi:hypothetical protein
MIAPCLTMTLCARAVAGGVVKVRTAARAAPAVVMIFMVVVPVPATGNACLL